MNAGGAVAFSVMPHLFSLPMGMPRGACSLRRLLFRY